MSVQALSWALNNAPAYLSSAERFVMVALADYVGSEIPDAWPSVATLARKTGLGRRTVQRSLRTLCAVRIITPVGVGPAKRSDRQPTMYRWHHERALTSWHRAVALLDDDGELPGTDEAPETTGYAVVPVPLTGEQKAEAARQAGASSVDKRPDNGAPGWHGAPETTPTGRQGDARTKDRNPQVEPGGSEPEVGTDRAREAVDNSAGAAAARAALLAALATRPDREVAS